MLIFQKFGNMKFAYRSHLDSRTRAAGEVALAVPREVRRRLQQCVRPSEQVRRRQPPLAHVLTTRLVDGEPDLVDVVEIAELVQGT